MLFPRQPPAPPPRHQFNQAEVTENEEGDINEVREHELQEISAEIALRQDEDNVHNTAEENKTSNTKSKNTTSTFTSFSIPSPSSLSTNVSYNSLNGNDRFTSWRNNPSSEMIMKILQRPREPTPPPPPPPESETSETDHNTSANTATLSEKEESEGESIFSKFNFKSIGLALFSSSPEKDDQEQEVHKKKEEEEELEESKKRESKYGNQTKNTKLVKRKTWNSPRLSKFSDVRQRPSIQTIPLPTRKVSKVETTASSLTRSVNASANTHINKSTTSSSGSSNNSIAEKNKNFSKQSPLSLTKNKGKTQINSKISSAKKTCTGVGAANNNLEPAHREKEVITVPELEAPKHKLSVHDDKNNKRSDHRRKSNSLCSSSNSSSSLSSSSSTSLSSLTNSSSTSSSSSSSTSSLGQSTASLIDKKANAQQDVNKTKELTTAADKMPSGDKSSQSHHNVEHDRHSQHSKHVHHHRHHHQQRSNIHHSDSNNKKRSQSSENMSLSSSTSSLSSTSSSSISSLSSSSLLPEQPSSGTAQSEAKSAKREHKHRHKHKHKHHKKSNNNSGSGAAAGSRRRSTSVGAKSGGNNGHDNEFATSSTSSSFAANAAQITNATPSAPQVLSFRDRVHKGVAPPPRKRLIRKRNASEPRPRTNITGPVDTFRVGQGPRRSALARRNNNLTGSNNKEEEKNVSTLSLLPERLRRRYFHVLLHVAQFWHNMMKVVLMKRQRTTMERAIAPHAAFVIQCAWRRLQQRRRLGPYNAWGFLCPWIRLQHQRRKRALEHSARVIQNISRSAQARSWVHFLYTHKHLLAGLHVIARKVHVWEDEKLLRHMRYQRDERNLLITNWQQASNSLLREERANWLHIVNDFYNLKRIGMKKSHGCEDTSTATAKQEHVQINSNINTINSMMSIDAMKVLPPFYEASALWCADTNLDLISRILSVESGEYLTCTNKTNLEVNNAIITITNNNNKTNKQNAEELHQMESMNNSDNSDTIYTENNSGDKNDSGKVTNDADTEHDKITNESVRSAFLELLIQSESVERKQLSHQLLQEHDAFCTPVVLASRSIRYAQTAEVPLLFAPLLLSFHSDYFLRRAVKLFCAEEVNRNAIVDEYDALPLCNLHRPVLLAKAEERRLHLIHNYAHVEDESWQKAQNEKIKEEQEEQWQIYTRGEYKTEAVQNKEEVCTFNSTQNAINAQNMKINEIKSFTREVQPNIFSATFPYNSNNNDVSKNTPNDANCSVGKRQQRPRPPTPPPRRRWAERTLPPLAHRATWQHKSGQQKKYNGLRNANDADMLNTYDGVISANANVREESNYVKNRVKRGKKDNTDETARVAADCCSTSSSSFVNVAATNSDAAVNMLMPNMLFTTQPSGEFSFVSGELKKGVDEKTSSVIHSSFCFGNSSITSENNKERRINNINGSNSEIVTTNISKIRDNVPITNNCDALPVLQNSNSVLFSASIEEYRNM